MNKLVNGQSVPLTSEEIAEYNQREADYEAEKQAYDKVAYKDLRSAAYPQLGEQLDMLWHAMDAGTFPMQAGWYDAIKAVKDEFPKPDPMVI